MIANLFLELLTLRQVPVVLFICMVFICVGTRITTLVRFEIALAHNRKQQQSKATTLPPVIPYWFPWLGSIFKFLTTQHGLFWRWVQKVYEKSGSEILTVILGGRPAYILMTTPLISDLFEVDPASVSHGYKRQVMLDAVGMRLSDVDRVFPKTNQNYHQKQWQCHQDHVLSTRGTNMLMDKFSSVLREELSKWQQRPNLEDIDFTHWIKQIMFPAAITTFFGSRILEVNPGLMDKYWQFDKSFMTLFYGLPRWLVPRPYRARENLLQSFLDWLTQMDKECDGQIPETDEWEPCYGSKVVRGRQRLFQEFGVSLHGAAILQMSFLYGFNSNSIPTTAWLLTHILQNRETVLPTIVSEVESTLLEDGSIDLKKLLKLPWLNSAFWETLRIYMDVIITREFKSDAQFGRYSLHRNGMVMGPTYLAHFDPSFWTNFQGGVQREDYSGIPGPDHWWAERFLTYDQNKQELRCCTDGTSGRLFPFGSGHHSCPGRNFAHLEILYTVAQVLLRFEFEVMGYQKRNDGKFAPPKVFAQFPGTAIVNMDGGLRVKLHNRSY